MRTSSSSGSSPRTLNVSGCTGAELIPWEGGPGAQESGNRLHPWIIDAGVVRPIVVMTQDFEGTPPADRLALDQIVASTTIDPSAQEVLMTRFMDVHDGFIGVTAEQLAAAHQQDIDIQTEEGVVYERAWLDAEAGKVFCLASGPSKEAVMRIHERAGHPTPQVYEITAEV